MFKNIVQIKDIVSINQSNYKPSMKWDYVNYLDTGNLTKNVVNEIQYIDLSVEKLPSRAKRIPNKNSILYSTVRPNQEHYGFIKDINVFNLLVSTGFVVMDVDENKAVPKYIYYYLIQPDIINMLQSIGETSTSTYPSISPKEIQSIELCLPTIKEQEQIANLLSSFDDKIENNNAIIANLEEQAQTIFKSWFVDMPKGSWTKGTVSDLGEVVAGGTPAKKNSEYYINGDIPWITPKDLSKINRKFVSKGATDITSLGLSKSSAKLVPRGTVLFSSRAPIGYIAIAKNDVSTNQGFKSIVPYENIGTPYVYYFLKNQTELIENMASGSTFKEISGSAMKKVPAAIPDKETLKEFNSFCQTLFLYQENLELQNEKLVEIRDTLLPKLMSGEIRVGEVIIEE